MCYLRVCVDCRRSAWLSLKVGAGQLRANSFFFSYFFFHFFNSVSSVLPSGQLSNVPWRRADVKYTNNEAYFDIIEEVDAIIDKNGNHLIRI